MNEVKKNRQVTLEMRRGSNDSILFFVVEPRTYFWIRGLSYYECSELYGDSLVGTCGVFGSERKVDYFCGREKLK